MRYPPAASLLLLGAVITGTAAADPARGGGLRSAAAAMGHQQEQPVGDHQRPDQRHLDGGCGEYQKVWDGKDGLYKFDCVQWRDGDFRTDGTGDETMLRTGSRGSVRACFRRCLAL